MADPAVVRPLAELDLDDEPRLDPDDVGLAHPGHLRRLRERRVGPLERLQQLQQPADLLLAEAGADVADVAERAALVHGEHERAEARRAVAAAAGVAGDEELLAPVRLQLEPVAAAAAREVGRARPLRHHALEPLLLRRGEQGGAVGEALREQDVGIPSIEQRGEPRAPFLDRQRDQLRPVGLEQVERVVDESARPALHRREARPALVVERADLAVEDGVRRLDSTGERSRD